MTVADIASPAPLAAKGYVTESSLRRKLEVDAFAPRMLDVMLDLATENPFADRFAYARNSAHWPDDGLITFGRHGDAPPIWVQITSRFYAPGGTVVLGTLKQLSDSPGTTGQYTTIRNGGSTDIEHEVDKTVELTDETSSELSEGIQLDMTTKESAEYGGVSGEMEQHLGITVDATQAQSHSKTETTTFSDKVVIPAAAEYAIVYSKTAKHFTQDYAINSRAEVGFTLTIHEHADWFGPHRGYILGHNNSRFVWSHQHQHYSAAFKSIHDFVGFLRGFDDAAPDMAGYYDHAGYRAQHGVQALEAPATMHLQLTGTNLIETNGDADYSVIDVKGVSDDDIKNRFGEVGNPVPPSIPHHVVRNAPAGHNFVQDDGGDVVISDESGARYRASATLSGW